MKMFMLIVKNIFRNKLRTILTSLGIMVLVLVVTVLWSVLFTLEGRMSEQPSNFKVIVTERWQIPSRMPFAYAQNLSTGAPRKEGDIRIADKDSMTWQFFLGSTEQDLKKANLSNLMFLFAMDPRKLTTMMDDLDDLPAEKMKWFNKEVDKMLADKTAIIVGKEKLKDLNKQVGDSLKLYSLNYKDINLEFRIVGVFPDGRYDQSAVMHRDYLLDAMDQYGKTPKGKHPMAEKTLNLVWLRVKDAAEFNQVSAQIENSPMFASPAVKCETAASGIAAFLDAFRDLLWGVKYLLIPAILVVLALIIANAISISVRERRLELAVLKVLGFQPYQLMYLVLGESLLIGTLSGLFSAGMSYAVINFGLGGINFPIAFFPKFYIPFRAVVWGLAIGSGTSLLGSFFPAWSAQEIKASEVFSKVA